MPSCLPQPAGGGSGPTGAARKQHAQHLAQLSRLSADYMQTPERPAIRTHVTGKQAQTDVSGYYVRAEGMVLGFVPGQVVSFEGAQHLIHKTRIVGDISQTTATHELWLQPLTLPLPAHKQAPHWPSRDVWAHVTANEHDPMQQGRIQVEFEWEHLDPQASGERAWLHLVTPYGGGHAGGTKASAYSGFYSVPEKGERVLVEFLGEWDSEAVILGTVRHTSQKAPLNPKDTKRWATPSGSEISMTTKGSDEVVRVRNKGNLVLEAHNTGGTQHVSLVCHGREEDSLHINVNGSPLIELRGSKDIFIYAQNNIVIKAEEQLHLEAKRITMLATDVQGITMQAKADNIAMQAKTDISANSETASVRLSAKLDVVAAARRNFGAMAIGNAFLSSQAVTTIEGASVNLNPDKPG